MVPRLAENWFNSRGIKGNEVTRFLTLLIVLLTLAISADQALAQSGPNWSQGFVPTPAEWQAEWQSKLDYNPTAPYLQVCSSASSGLVPSAPGSAAQFLNGLCQWGSPSGGGNVTGAGSSTAGNLAQITNSSSTAITDSSIAVSNVDLLSANQTATGNKTFSGTVNFTGNFEIGGATLTLPVGVSNGGTGLTSQTSGVIYRGAGTGIPQPSALTDNGTLVAINEPLDLVTQPLVKEIPNNTGTGTSLNKLAKLTGAPSTAVLAATTDTDGIDGIVIGGQGTSGNAQIAFAGQAACAFDGSTTANDWIVNSSTTAGDCHDSGSANRPTGVQAIGRVLSSNASAGTYTIDVVTGYTNAAGGGGVTWPTAGNIVISNGTNTPSSLAPSTPGDCVIVSGGAFVLGGCGGSGGGNVSASGTVTTGNVATWNGTFTLSPTGVPYGLTGNSTLVETSSSGLISNTLISALPLANIATIGGGTVLGNTGTTAAIPAATAAPILGVPGTTAGQLKLAGSTSGTAIVTTQAVAGSPTLTLPNTTGTIADGATSPITLNTTTGTIGCATCLTSNQTIVLTGQVTGSGTTGIATSLAANTVTYSNLQQVASLSLIGNPTSTNPANAQSILLGSGGTLAFSGSTLQTAAGTGAVTWPANSFATSITAGAVGGTQLASSAVTYAKMQNETAMTMLGNPSASGTAAPSEISVGGAGSGCSFSGASLICAGLGGAISAVNRITTATNTLSSLSDTFTQEVWLSAATSNKVDTIPACGPGVTADFILETDGQGTAGQYPIDVHVAGGSIGIASAADYFITVNHGTATFQCDGTAAIWRLVSLTAQGSSVRPVTGTTDSISAKDNGNLIKYNSTSTVTATLPDIGTASILSGGFQTMLYAQGAGITLNRTASSTINGVSSIAVPAGGGAFVFAENQSNNYVAVPLGANRPIATLTTSTPTYGSSTGILFYGPNWSSSYNTLHLHCHDLTLSGNNFLFVYLGEGGGGGLPTWQTSANYIIASISTNTAGSAVSANNFSTTSPSSDLFGGLRGGGTATTPTTIDLDIDDVASTTAPKLVRFNVGTFGDGTDLFTYNGSSYWNGDTAAITGIEVVVTSGTMSGGCSLAPASTQ